MRRELLSPDQKWEKKLTSSSAASLSLSSVSGWSCWGIHPYSEWKYNHSFKWVLVKHNTWNVEGCGTKKVTWHSDMAANMESREVASSGTKRISVIPPSDSICQVENYNQRRIETERTHLILAIVIPTCVWGGHRSAFLVHQPHIW